MKKIFTYRVVIILSMLLCVAVYTVCLRKISFCESISLWIRERDWLNYLGKLICVTVIGWLWNYLLKSKDREQRRSAAALMFLAIFAYVGFIEWFIQTTAGWQMKNLIVSLWPFIAGMIALWIRRKICKREWFNSSTGVCLYYLIAAICILLIESKLMIFSEFFRRELGDTIYLFSVSVAAWIITGKDKKRCLKHRRIAIGTGRWEKGIPVFAALAAFYIIFYQHPRILEILSGLSNPIQSVEGGIYDINWLGYRMALLFRGWAEDLSMMKYEQAMFTVERCPLLCIKYTGGTTVMLLVLALEALILYFLISEFRKAGETEDRTLRKVLVAAVVIHSILGLFAEMFLITSTDVGLLLLRNPGDVIIILYLLQSRNGSGVSDD